MKEQERRFTEMMQAFDRLYEEYAKAKGMTYLSLTVLDTIYECENGCTQKQICEETYYPKQSVNLIVKSFWESGYIELREIPSDRRNKRIVLTEKGRAYADDVVGKLWRVDEAATERLSAEQRERLLELIEIYEKAYSDGIRRLID